MKALIGTSLLCVLMAMAFIFVRPSETIAYYNNNLMVETAPCPCEGETYDRCWAYCGGCNCSPSSQTICDCPDQ